MKIFFRNIFGFFIIGIVIIGITFFSGRLRQITLPFGITSYISGSDTVLTNLKKDLLWQTDQMKEKSMNVTLKDVVAIVSRVRTVGSDVQEIKTYVVSKITEGINKIYE